MISFSEFKQFCNGRAIDGCWDMLSAIKCISIYQECDKISIIPWFKNKYFQKHYGQIITEYINKKVIG